MTTETDILGERLRLLETQEPPIVLDWVDAAVSDPPTQGEANAAFGATATQARDGWMGIIDDSGAGTDVWICVAKNGAWHFIKVVPSSTAQHNLLSATHGDTLASAVSRGSLIYGNSTPAYAELNHPGAANRLLRTPDANDVSWSDWALVGTAAQTYTLPGATASIPGGSGAANQVAYWTGANSLAGDNDFLFDGSVVYTGGADVWRVGETVYNLDLTGTDYDTDAELQAIGIKLSDADSPFPSSLYYTIGGSWSHSAGNGWQPASAVGSQGPGLLIPLMRPGNWKIDLAFNLRDDANANGYILSLGYIAGGNHVGACSVSVDGSATSVNYRAYMYTNDGDDTFTAQYTGAVLSGAASRTISFAHFNGCVGVWDDQDDAWHWYAGRQNAGHAYTPHCVFIQIIKNGLMTLSTMYLSQITVTYLGTGI